MAVIKDKIPAALCYCLIGALFPFLSFLQMSILNVIGAYLSRDLGFTVNDISLLLAFFIYFDAASLIPVGVLLDRYSLKSILLIGIGFLAIGSLLFSMIEGLGLAIIARILIGISHGFAFLACFHAVKIYYPPQKAAAMLGVMLAIIVSGGMMAQAPSELLIQCIGWRMFFVVQMVASIVLGIVVFFVIPQEPVLAEERLNMTMMRSVLVVSKNLKNWYAGFYICLMNMPMMIFGALCGVLYLTEKHHVTPLNAATITSMLFVGTVVGCPLVGIISDYFRNRRQMMLLTALAGLGLVWVLYSSTSLTLFNLSVIFFLLGIFSSGQVLGFPVVTESNSTALGGVAMGFVNVVIMALIASFQILFGALWGSESTQWIALGILPGSFIISFFLALVFLD